MKTTNIEKWNYWKGIIDAREKLFVEAEVAEIPIALYSVYPNGTIGEKIVTQVTYNNQQYFGFNKRPTKNDVDKVKQFAENNRLLLKENIRYHYEEKHNYGKSSGAVKINDLHTFLAKEDAERKSADIKDKKAHEEILLQNGHSRCERCGKVVPTNEILTDKIISIATYGRSGRIMKFCSSTCAANEQCAHEG